MRHLLLGCFLSIVVAIPTILPLFASGLLAAHDAPIHVTRTYLFASAFADGHIPPRWAGELLYGYGYPVFEFLYPLPNFFGTVIHWIGFSFADAFEIAAAMTMIVAALGMFVWAKSWWGFWGGLLSVVAYTYASYHAVDLYVRGTIGELWSLAFFPWAMWIGQRVTSRPSRRSIALFAFLLILLILSHNITAAMMVPVIVLWVILQRQSMISPAGSGLLALGATSFFWVPALAEESLTIIDTAIRSEFHYADHFVYPLQLFRYSPWGFGGSKPGPIDGMSFYLQWPWMAAFLCTGIAFFLLHGRWRRVLLFSIVVTLFAAFMTLTWSKPIWDTFSSLLFLLQYPWRFLSLVIAMGAFSIGSVITLTNVLKKPQVRFSAAILLTLTIASLMLWKTLPLFQLGPESGIDGNIYTSDKVIAEETTTYADEHLPIWVKEKPLGFPDHRVELLEGAGVVKLFDDGPRHAVAAVDLDSDSVLRIHKFDYPGWRVTVDGVVVEKTHDNPLGTIDVSVPKGSHRVEARFTETPLRMSMNVLSLISFGGILLAFFKFRSPPLVLSRRMFLS